ncbi:MAG: fibronectin type III domain-containing protein [Anaeromyxobacteraceae bacterium]
MPRPSLPLTVLACLALAAGACGGGGGGGGTPDALPPAAPTGLAATPTSSTSVALGWSAPADPITRYELERAAGAGGAFTALASPAAPASGYSDGGLVTGTAYRYRVRAVGAGGPSAWSAEASATPPASAPAAPAPPAAVSVSPLSASGLRVAWADQSTDETGFEIERAIAAQGPFGLVGTAAANASAWDDGGLAAGQTYHYRVRAVNAAGVSGYAAAASGTTSAAAAPAAPTGLAAAQELAGSSVVIRLGWTDAATDETGYEVQRSPDGSTWGATQALAAGASSYVDPSPLPLAGNWYRVRAVNGASPSGWAQVTIYNGPVLAGVICPGLDGTSATALYTTSVRVGWTWNVCGGVGIERAASASGPWSEVARLGNYVFGAPPDATWDDTGLAPGTTYHYRLRALPLFAPSPVGGGTWSPGFYTTTYAATTTAAVGAPSGLSVSNVTATTAALAWTAASGADGYAVDYALAAAGPFTEAFRVGAVTSTGVTGLTPGTTHGFRVRATKGTASSPPSNVVTFTTSSTLVLRATGDAFVMESTAVPGNELVNTANDHDAVGCFFSWTVGPGGQGLHHNCAGTALRFDTAALAGKTVVSAALVMWPCGLAPHPVDDARYQVWALASAWNPATVTFRTLPQIYAAGSWWVPAPTAAGAQAWDVTTIVKNWVSGTWAQNGLYVGQSPIVDRIPTWNDQQWDYQDQTTPYCSLEKNGGSAAWAPSLEVEVR